MNRPLQKGTQVNHATPSAQAPSLRTGLFASLSGGGSGAPSPSLFGFAPSRPASPEISLGRSASRRLLAPLVLAAVVALLALAAAPASAAATHAFLETFGSAAQPTFGDPEGMAVDQATGDLYVIDIENQILSRWNPDGTPANFSALGSNEIDGSERLQVFA